MWSKPKHQAVWGSAKGQLRRVLLRSASNGAVVGWHGGSEWFKSFLVRRVSCGYGFLVVDGECLKNSLSRVVSGLASFCGGWGCLCLL